MDDVEPTCSIEDCANPVLARGWCRKHYARWKSHGDPTKFIGKREPMEPVTEKRWIGQNYVHFTESGHPFVLTIRKRRDGEPTESRRYGVVIFCEKCGKEAFIKESGGKTDRRFCSHKCAGPVVAHQRRKGKSYKATQTADATFSKIVRAPGVCENCGATDRLQCAHGFSRRYRNVRWDFRNAFCLCARCHMYYTHRPIGWDDWLRNRWGDKLYDEIKRTALLTSKVDVAAIIEYLYLYRRENCVPDVGRVTGHAGWTGLTKDEEEA